MPPALKKFCRRWLVNTLGVMVATNVVSGIQYDSLAGLLVAALLLGILNAILRPILLLFSLPLVILTLGLFTFVINAILLYLVAWIVIPFHVSSFGSAFWGALVISAVSLAVNPLIGADKPETEGRERQPPPTKKGPGGPIIDV